MMRLTDLLRALTVYQIERQNDAEISSITADSRQVVPGALFVAYPGVNVDGARFIPDALQRGAAAIVVEGHGAAADPNRLQSTVNRSLMTVHCSLITVPNARAALAHLAAAWNDLPSRKLRVVGVTGTDGKTTTCTLAASILSAAGHKVGTITTVAATIGDREIDTGFHTTTPDATEIQRYLAQMVDAGMQYAVIEATSHGLAQHRLDAVEFDVATVTNITHEHLDLHGSWENYRDAKALLFQGLAASYHKPRTAKVAVLNADDSERGVFDSLRAIPADEQIVYGTRDPSPAEKAEDDRRAFGGAAVRRIFARDVVSTPSGLRFTAVTPHGELPIASSLIGSYNVSNILAALGVGLARRVPYDAMSEGVARVRSVVGRMQVMQAEPFTAIVDFAHTPNALRVALETARTLTRGRVIVVFGCAGLRDVTKRAMMGEVAGRLADRIVLTAEDPRTESLASINGQIVEGLQRAGRRQDSDYLLVDDRGEAIKVAVEQAHAGDLVIVTGKGHERSMCFGTTEYPWSDQDVLRAALENKDA